MKTVFIDGAAGTTGLRIHERLARRPDLQLIILPEEQRKDPQAIAEALNASDLSFLCLPDAAAKEAAAMVENPDTILLDTSTAHRTAPGWVYGMPELGASQRAALLASRRIAVPGCHASGFIALARPLAEDGLIPRDTVLRCFSLTGYSGGGKKMIAEYEAADRSPLLKAPRQYGLSQQHKHLPEMAKMSGLPEPLFCPIVADFFSGMEVTIPLAAADLTRGVTVEDIRAAYAERYRGPVVRYAEGVDEAGFLSAGAFSGLDSMEISVQGSEERILLCARYDNLGKGASGAAIQCMNLLLGLSETTGLAL